MGENRMVLTVLLLLGAAVFQLPAQQNEADYKKVEELKAKAEAGDAASELQLGLRYGGGEGVRKNEVEAVKWFRKAAEQNNATAQALLGTYLYDKGGTKNNVEAVKWFRKAAEQNDAAAQAQLGVCYFKGTGVTKNE